MIKYACFKNESEVNSFRTNLEFYNVDIDEMLRKYDEIVFKSHEYTIDVGMKVRVKKNLVVGYSYNGVTFYKNMKRLKGKVFTVSRIGWQQAVVLNIPREMYSRNRYRDITFGAGMLEVL